jgi:alkaline phosphatase
LAISGCRSDTKDRTEAGADRVILMVADGAGFNTWLATSMYLGEAGPDPFDDGTWIRLATDTYALRDGDAETGPGANEQDPTFVYDPVRAWDPAPTEGEAGGTPYFFEGYRWLRRAPDSANTATAMSTGRRTYIGAINVDGRGRPLEPTIASLADATRRAVGIVTSVPFSHATPAALAGAHDPSRRAYAELALQMLGSDRLDFVAGCGNPAFDDDGVRVERPEPRAYRWVGGATAWRLLTGRGGDDVAGDSSDGSREPTSEEIRQLKSWTLVQSLDEIAALETGPLPVRPLLVPEVALTLQQTRHANVDPHTAEPFSDPRIATVPDLATLTRIALRSLSSNPHGFFLHVEGGAVDWAMHGNEMGRMIEEMLEFREALDAVQEWVERESDWSRTLLIVTADHDHLLGGPNAAEIPFDPLRDEGERRMPGHQWLHDGHSNALVPLFAKGAGAERFLDVIAGNDPVHGPYVEQTRIFDVIADAMRHGATPSP